MPENDTLSSSPARCARAIRWLLLLIPVVLYAGSLNHPLLLVLDDCVYYGLNPSLWLTCTSTLMSDYAPVSQLTIWLDLQIFGSESWVGARLHSLLWFGLGGLAVHALVLRLTQKAGLAFAVALLYEVHPVCAPSVLWLSERKHLVCFALSFWSINCYLAAVTAGRRRQWAGYYGAALLLALLATLAKPHAVAIPLMLAVCELTHGCGSRGRAALRVLPFALLSAAFVFFSLCFLRSDLNRPHLGGSRLAALVSDGPILLRYLWHTLWPGELAIYYGVEELSASSLLGWAAALALVALAGVTLLITRQRALMACGWLLALAALSPAVNLVPQLAPMADHYQQWALPGWLLVLGLLISDRLPPEKTLRYGLPLLSVAALYLAFFAQRRVDEFSTGRRLFEVATARQPQSTLNWGFRISTLPPDVDPSFRAEIALRALRCPDAARLLPQLRWEAVRLAAIHLFTTAGSAEARRFAEEQCALFKPGESDYQEVTLAEVAACTDRPEEARRLLEHVFGELKPVAARLRQATREGRALPHHFRPLVLMTSTDHDAFAKGALSELAMRTLQVLAMAYLKLERNEEAFDVAAVLVNAQPNGTNRMLLAVAYRRLGQETTAQKLLH